MKCAKKGSRITLATASSHKAPFVKISPDSPTPSEPQKAPDPLRDIKMINPINYPRASGGDRTLEIIDVVLIVVNPSIAGVQVDVGT